MHQVFDESFSSEAAARTMDARLARKEIARMTNDGQQNQNKS